MRSNSTERPATSHKVRFAVVGPLAVATVAWVAFAWILASWLGFFLQENSIRDLSLEEAACLAGTFALAPALLFSAWALALQGRMLDRRQVGALFRIVSGVAVLSAAVVALGFALGWLKDATPL